MSLSQFNIPDARKTYPAVDLVRRDPKLAAMVSKLTSPVHVQPTRDAQGNRKTMLTNTSGFKSVLAKRAKRNSDASSILRLLPDIELSAQILVSSILSPKDMTSMDLLYMGPKNLLSPELSASMLNRLKEHFEESYKIKGLLTEMLREPLIEKGSYPIAVIPENAIDDFINGDQAVSMEAMRAFVNDDGMVKHIGVLGNYTTERIGNAKLGVTMESYYRRASAAEAEKINGHVHYKDETMKDYKNFVAEEYLLVTDNPTTLKIPKLNAKTKTAAIKAQYNRSGLVIASEAQGAMSDQRIEKLIYRNRQNGTEPIAVMKKPHELKRRSVGSPLIMKLPSESIIPVHVPGNVKQHVGYFVLLDEEGNPLEAPDGDQYYNGLASGMGGGSSSLASSLIRKVESNLGTNTGSFDSADRAHLDFASQVYADMVERDLISRIKNGMHASAVSLAKNEEVYRIMLSRVLAKKYTQVLYLPIEFVTYIAFKYGDDGIGRSLLDDTAMINTLRSIMLFTDVMGAVKNSIGRTKVSATLPENDPNPMKTIETAQDEIVRSRMLGIPLGVSNPADIFEFIQRAGYEWEFTGHPGLPDLKFDFQQTTSGYTKADTDLQDLLRKSSIMAFGLSPETVDNGFSTEFATTAVANNILLSKRVSMMQDLFTPQLSDHLRKVANNTEDLVQDLRAILAEKKDGIRLELDDVEGVQGVQLTEEIKDKLLVNKALQEFLNGFYVELPKPASVTLENQMNDLKTYTEALDLALDAYISDTFFTTATAGEMANEANTIRAMVKAYYIRKWLSDKGMMPELSELTSVGEDGDPQMNFMKMTTDHIQALVRSGITALASLQPIVQAANKDFAAMGAEASEPGSDTSSDDSGGGDDFGGMDFGGGDEFALDEGADETLTDPEAPVEEEESAAPEEQAQEEEVQEEEAPAEEPEVSDDEKEDKEAKK